MVAVPASNMLINNLACLLAKLLQLCPTLCDPIDGSPPDCAFPGILQARTLEWVGMSFSNAGKWNFKGTQFRLKKGLETAWKRVEKKQVRWRDEKLRACGLIVVRGVGCIRDQEIETLMLRTGAWNNAGKLHLIPDWFSELISMTWSFFRCGVGLKRSGQ